MEKLRVNARRESCWPIPKPAAAAAAAALTVSNQERANEKRNFDLMGLLPDSVILDILGAIKDAKSVVRCSVLSKRFHSLVRQVPHLRFTISDFYHLGSPDVEQTRFQDAVGRMVVENDGLKSLEIVCEDVDEEELGTWLSCAGMSLENLHLEMCPLPNEGLATSLVISSHVLEHCKRLRSLEVWCRKESEQEYMCELGPLPLSLGPFRQLESLQVGNVLVEGEAHLSSLLSLLPVLRVLILDSVCGLDAESVQVFSPTLECLMIRLHQSNSPTAEGCALRELVVDAPALQTLCVEAAESLVVRRSSKLASLTLEAWTPDVDWELHSDITVVSMLDVGSVIPFDVNGHVWWKKFEMLLQRFRLSLRKLIWKLAFFEEAEEDEEAPTFGELAPVPVHPWEFCRHLGELRRLVIEQPCFISSLERGLRTRPGGPEIGVLRDSEGEASPMPIIWGEDGRRRHGFRPLLPKLRSLDLAVNAVTADTVAVLAFFLASSPALESLRLRIQGWSDSESLESQIRRLQRVRRQYRRVRFKFYY
ncbi:hypothetical protein CBR_g46671 [Chara braunii]|uniref:F-box domain-containing protein n=1 Tax=Chara braunii TaxID=69332 RepID=A0A388M122_CHABU|nr:hypothetical protein CBR_g46671 [Chara braunii]|eukprot:GBG88182.1 hypothetical protein CBR_g46671 [Chara braunii]